jgi:DNA-binding IclR family transcriptional regulator
MHLSVVLAPASQSRPGEKFVARKQLGHDTDRKGVQSVEVAARILSAVGDANGPSKLKDIAAAIGISASRAHGYLVSLVRADLVHQDIQGLYDLGERARRLGLAALSRMDVMQVVDSLIQRLRNETEETIASCVWSEHGPVVVRWIRGSQPLAVNVNLGSVLPVLGTAMGLIFLAYLPKSVTRPFVESELRGMSRRKISRQTMKQSDLEPLTQEIQRNRLAYVEGTLVPDMGAIAVGVFDSQAQLVAAVGLLGRGVSTQGSAREPAVRALLEAAQWGSEQLGYRHIA